MMIKKFNLISCCDLENGIGISSKNDLPWILYKEYQYFQFVTQRIDDDLSFLNQFKLGKGDYYRYLAEVDTGDAKNGSISIECENSLVKKEIISLSDANIANNYIENDDVKNNYIENDYLKNDYNHKSINDDKKTKQELLFNKDDLNNHQIENRICNCIIMGRRTWQSLPENYRPLKNRLNLVISRQYDSISLKIDKNYLFKSLKDALIFATKQIFVNQIFIVGGEQLYKDAIEMNECNKIYLTRINSKFNCDRFFPSIDNSKFKEINEFNLKDINQYENNLNYKFYIYERI